jgi:hypothetical protein
VKPTTTIKPGQHFAARFLGSNGDLILGRVERVTRGRVILTNLLTGRQARKDLRVLLSRNAPVSTQTARAVLGYWSATASRVRTRQLAVALTP